MPKEEIVFEPYMVATTDRTRGYVDENGVDFAVSNGDRSSDMDKFEPSLTRQEFKDECDINVIMAQYDKYGVISHQNQREPMYLDLSDIPDLALGLKIMNDAQAAFMTLPAVVRKEFDNDALKFVEFAQDEANVEKMREWGLAAPAAAPPEPQLVRVVPEPSDSAPPPSPSKTP